RLGRRGGPDGRGGGRGQVALRHREGGGGTGPFAIAGADRGQRPGAFSSEAGTGQALRPQPAPGCPRAPRRAGTGMHGPRPGHLGALADRGVPGRPVVFPCQRRLVRGGRRLLPAVVPHLAIGCSTGPDVIDSPRAKRGRAKAGGRTWGRTPPSLRRSASTSSTRPSLEALRRRSSSRSTSS